MRASALLCCNLVLLACGAEPAHREAPASKATPQPAPVVSNAWVAEVLPGQEASAGFLDLENRGTGAEALLGVTSNGAGTVELHRIVQTANGMAMEPVPRIDLPPGKVVKLDPGGLHLMFFDLTHPWKAGEKVKLTFRFEHAAPVEVEAEVRGLEGKADG